jgi:hypothetical protein
MNDEDFEVTAEHGEDVEKAMNCPRCNHRSMRHVWRRMPICVMTLSGEEKILVRAKVLKCDRCSLRMGCSCTVAAINEACAELRKKQLDLHFRKLKANAMLAIDDHVKERYRMGIAAGISAGPIISLFTHIGNIWLGCSALAAQLAILLWCYWPRKAKESKP